MVAVDVRRGCRSEKWVEMLRGKLEVGEHQIDARRVGRVVDLAP
jgi:hypothetical protein